MTKDPRVNLAQILESVQRVLAYTEEGEERFFRDAMVQDAVARNFQIIGEAAKRVPQDARVLYPDIPWRGLTGFRDVLVHEYDSVELGEVWRLVRDELPKLQRTLLTYLPPLEELEAELAGEMPPDSEEDEPGRM